MDRTLEERAIIAYGNRAFRDHSLPRMSTGTAHIVEIEGRPHVLVCNAVGPVGLYRITARGSLKWVRNWPALDHADIAKQIVYATHVVPFAAKDPALATL